MKKRKKREKKVKWWEEDNYGEEVGVTRGEKGRGETRKKR